MKISKAQRNNFIFLGIILIMIIPQTRMPIQVLLHKGLSLFGTSVIDEEERKLVKFEDWELTELEGKAINFIDSEGKVILINFWATWCPPCVAEMPSFQKLYSDYGDKVTFIFISNEEPDTIKNFMEKKEYDFKVYMPQSSYPEVFDVRSIPQTYLIDNNNKIVIDKKGAANWNSRQIRNQLDLLLSE
jgi:thiol-disulfide isomerase/thioredoxin